MIFIEVFRLNILIAIKTASYLMLKALELQIRKIKNCYTTKIVVPLWVTKIVYHVVSGLSQL